MACGVPAGTKTPCMVSDSWPWHARLRHGRHVGQRRGSLWRGDGEAAQGAAEMCGAAGGKLPQNAIGVWSAIVAWIAGAPPA